MGERDRQALLGVGFDEASAFQRGFDSAGDPGTAIDPAPDHHAVGSGLLKGGPGAVAVDDVAVDQNRHRYGPLDRRDGGPVGDALVKLVAGAAMNGDGLGADRLGARRDLGGVAAGVVPTEPHLDRHGHVNRLDRSGHEGLGQIGLAHQGGATSRAGGDFLGGATEVQVYDLRAGLGGHSRALGHERDVATDQLDHRQRQALADRRATDDVGAPPRELRAGHHLRRHIWRAERRGRFSEGQVRDPGHRRDPHPTGDANPADLELVAHFLIIPVAFFLGTLCGAVKPGSTGHEPPSD